MDSNFFKYSYKTKTKESLAIAVFNTGIQKCKSGYTWGPALRDHYLLHYIISGKGTYQCDGVSYDLAAGDLFIAYPDKIITYTADLQQPWEYCWVGFHGTEADRLVRLTPFREDHLVLHLPEAGIQERITEIFTARGNRPSDEMKMIGGLYCLLAQIAEQQPQPTDVTDITSTYIENALKYIQYNYSHTIDVTTIADSIGISRSHLYRVFMKHMGMSPNEYLTRYRINKACSLLRNSNLTITNIANSVGYDDPLYFSRVFKKVKGVSPSGYLQDVTQRDEI